MNSEPIIDHLGVPGHGCNGLQICPRCGRRMCDGCKTWTDDGKDPSNKPHESGHKGECLICSKMYTEDQIKLWPKPAWFISKLKSPKKEMESKKFRRIIL